MDALIAGGGIGGLTMALTCRQIGLAARVYEASPNPVSTGLGITLQPIAVRELIELGLEDDVSEVAVAIDRLVIAGADGRPRWSEARGRAAGWPWPQLAVHRADLHAALHAATIERCGADTVVAGRPVTGYEHARDGVVVLVAADDDDGAGIERVDAPVLVGADGLHSTVRSQMFPGEAGPRWRGSVLWRGTSVGAPVNGEHTLTVIDGDRRRVIVHPISPPRPDGSQLLNWVAERTYDAARGWRRGDWDTAVNVEEFIDAFEQWRFEWLDVPSMIRSSEVVYEYPMVDRDPVDHWTHGAVALIGDAAHPAYPISSNGASQAIVDARVLGAAFADDGVGQAALHRYERELHDDRTLLVLRNRSDRTSATLGLPVDEAVDALLDGATPPEDPDVVRTTMAGYTRSVAESIAAAAAAAPRITPAPDVPTT